MAAEAARDLVVIALRLVDDFEMHLAGIHLSEALDALNAELGLPPE
ncbi:MAG: hypothetical protein KGL48_14120 [Sphingomonadales bacterium]|nr:hypothetical protein [Sphingomonadales bacterium]MDE2569506.1 hypothetical protein [Sphingomonadales bacterium]